MVVNLTRGAISMLVTGKCTSNDLKPVLQVTNIDSGTHSIDNKQWYGVMLSDGSFKQVGIIAEQIFISNKLQKGSIVQLTLFQLIEPFHNSRSYIVGFDLNVIHSKCDIIDDPKLYPLNITTPLVDRTTPTIPDEDQNHANSRHVEEPPTSKQKQQDHVDSLLNEDIDDSRHHVEEPPTSIHNPTTSTQKCSSHSITQNNTDTMMGVNLTPGAITNGPRVGRVLLINDLNVTHSKCDIIVNQEPCPRNDIPLVERSTPTIPDEDHVDVSHAQESVTSSQKCSETQSRKRKHQLSSETPVLDRSKPAIIEDVDNSHPAKDPSPTTQKCSSHSLNQSKKRKCRSSNNNISKVVEDVSKMTKLTMKKIKTVDVGFKRLETLEEDVSKMTKMMMEKSKEDVVGFKKLETLEEDVSQMTKMMKKNKEDDVGACFKKLETLEENVSKLMRMMMEKNKEDDMGACIEKLDKMGWGAQDPMYDTALLLFLKGADYRKLWLHLKPECCGKWVKIAGSIFGLLD